MQKNILRLSEIDNEHTAEVGQEIFLLSQAHSQNIPVLDSFVISPHAFEAVLTHNNIPAQLDHILGNNLFSDKEYQQIAFQQISDRIDSLKFPDEILSEIFTAYFNLGFRKKRNSLLDLTNHLKRSDPLVNVRSRDLKTKSEIAGESNLIFAIRTAWKSYLTLDSLKYLRVFSHLLEQSPSIIVSETFQNYKKIVVEDKLITNLSEANLTDEQISQIQKFSEQMNRFLYFPHNYEYVINNEQIYLAKITTHSPPVVETPQFKIEFFKSPLKQKESTHNWREILSGKSLSRGAKIGHVKLIKKNSDLYKIHQGDILVANSLSLEYLPAINKSSAIILESKKQNDYFHSLALKRGIPLVNNVTDASKLLRDNQLVMVSGVEGKIYMAF